VQLRSSGGAERRPYRKSLAGELAGNGRLASAWLGIAAGLYAFFHERRWLVLGWLLTAGIGFGASIGAAGRFVTESVEESETGVAMLFSVSCA
jgi:hypothetical protein